MQACAIGGSLTVLFGARVYLLATDSISGSSEGQNLDTVVGVFLQPFQL